MHHYVGKNLVTTLSRTTGFFGIKTFSFELGSYLGRSSQAFFQTAGGNGQVGRCGATHIGINTTVEFDGAQGVGGNAQLDPALLAGDPEPALVQVRQPAAAGLVVGVRNIVAALNGLSGHLANACHGAPRW